MLRIKLLAVVFVLCAAAVVGIGPQVAQAGTILSPHLRQAGDVAFAVQRIPYVVKVQKTGSRVRRNAPAKRPGARQNRQRNHKVVRPPAPRAHKPTPPNKPRVRKIARPEKPRIRRKARPEKRRVRKLARPNKPHVRPGKRHTKKHRRRKRKVFIYGGFTPYYRYYPSYPSYTYYEPRRYEGRCAYWEERCVAEWGYENPDFYGCMQYHRCD